MAPTATLEKAEASWSRSRATGEEVEASGPRPGGRKRRRRPRSIGSPPRRAQRNQPIESTEMELISTQEEVDESWSSRARKRQGEWPVPEPSIVVRPVVLSASRVGNYDALGKAADHRRRYTEVRRPHFAEVRRRPHFAEGRRLHKGERKTYKENCRPHFAEDGKNVKEFEEDCHIHKEESKTVEEEEDHRCSLSAEDPHRRLAEDHRLYLAENRRYQLGHQSRKEAEKKIIQKEGVDNNRHLEHHCQLVSASSVPDNDAAAASASIATEVEGATALDFATEEAGTEAAASASTATEACALMSPICKPSILLQVIGYDSSEEEIQEQLHNADPAIVDAYEEERQKYFNKLGGQMKLLTLDRGIPYSCLNNHDLLLVRAHATKTILKAAKFVVSLSSYIDNKLLRQCSGFLVGWDENTKSATILTSAHIICCKSSLNEWLGEQKYAPHAKVYVQLATDRIKGQLLYYHKHYGFALICVTVDRPTELACFGSEVNFMQSIYVLGRDENLNLRVSSGRVQYEGPTIYERHHYMYMQAVVLESTIGGPVIDINGDVMGMACLCAHMGFIPNSVLQKCLHILMELKCIPRLQLGLKLSPIMFMDITRLEKISRECSCDTGLIVKEVAGGSYAEKLDMRAGDIILSVNGEQIATTVDLELMLLRICEENLGRGNGHESNVDVPVDVFYTSRGRTVRLKLTAFMSDDVEVVKEGTYYVSATEGTDDESDRGRPSSVSGNDDEVGDT